MTEYYARSPKEKKGIPAQTYAEHIQGVFNKATEYATDACKYTKKNKDMFLQAVKGAACFHDLGKLHSENQKILSGERQARSLPIHHWDAGAALLLPKNQAASATVYAHHIGYTNFADECNKGDAVFRDTEFMDRTNQLLPELENRHRQAVSLFVDDVCGFPTDKAEEISVFLRLLLSCLVDADHTDAAINNGNYHESQDIIPLYPKQRLEMLDAYIAGKQSQDLRNLLRTKMYNVCKKARVKEHIASCSSPVGSGKTTAVMAHLLTQAHERGLRRIFVVLPFTNIITQSVEVYRKALVLPDENPEDVVAELHHRADFESEDSRYLSSLWRAPIIVTTAVSFFETLASKTPSVLRRLHELPGSAIFVDESHAALPTKLLPLTWKWINCYGKSWGCYWVMASGSLCQFWDIKEISDENQVAVQEIMNSELKEELAVYEQKRIVYRHDLMNPKNADELINWVSTFPGPRLVILNTLQSAAVIANCLKTQFGREKVEHISTALTAEDRRRTLQRVKNRLDDTDDIDWSLVATSCVEAGIDLSFRTGFRELGSLCSLLQAAGRVNREGKIANSEMWVFCLQTAENSMLKTNPGMKDSASVLQRYFYENKEITPSLCTEAIENELKLSETQEKFKRLVYDESNQGFSSVEAAYRVIDSDTRIAVVSAEMEEKILLGEIDWQELQKHSVQIAKYVLDKTDTPKIAGDIYFWNRGYNNFLGYMAGIVQPSKVESTCLIV